MAFIHGKNRARQEISRLTGSLSQIGGIRRMVLADGPEKGVEALQFRTGTGFSFTVLADRGLDISHAEHCGRSLAWQSSVGDISPCFYEPEGAGWLRGFYGGLMVTCGLASAGAKSVDQGEELGLHGRYSNIPARSVSFGGEWLGDEYEMWVSGEVRETRVFGENLVMKRRITTRLGESRVLVHDRVRNDGFETWPHMILYHINAGFPVVEAGSELISPTKSVVPRDKFAEQDAEGFAVFLPPTPGFKERVYYHDMAPLPDGSVYVALVNRALDGGFGFYVKYSKNELPFFTQWKMNGEGTYVVGLEPANCHVEGRAKERERGTLQFLQPGEEREYHLEIGVLASASDVAGVEERVRAALK